MRSLARLLLGVLAAGSLFLAPAIASALTVSTSFDTDLEGWTPTGLDFTFTVIPPAVTDLFLVPNPGDMIHQASGGNPDGYARLTDLIEEPSSFAQAPAPYTGDLSPFIGGTFSFDHRLFDRGINDSGGPAVIAPYAFLIVSGDLFDLNALVFAAPAPAGNTDWIHFDVDLAPVSQGGDLRFITDVDASVLFPDFPVSGTIGSILGRSPTKTFEQIMASASAVLVPFELSNNEGNQESEHAGIDNIRLADVPEPGALALLLASGALLWRRRVS
jgi:hypothetical protein